MPLQQCPKCQRSLNPPLKSTGRQICMKCGWTDKPRQGNSPMEATPPVEKPSLPKGDLTPMDIQKLLNQAAEESLTNMKPKWKRQKEVNGKNPKNPPEPPGIAP